MAPSALTVIRDAFLDLEEVAIGSLVPDVLNPGQDYWPEKPSPPPPDQVTKRSVENLRELLSNEEHLGVRTRLSHLFTGDAIKSRGSKLEIKTPKSTGYFLKQPKSVFSGLCKDNDTKLWIEETLRDSPIFFVVGLITVTHAEIDHGRSHSKEYKSSAEIPMTSIVSSGVTDIFPGGNVLDVGGAFSVGDKSKTASSFIAPGERIVGVQYRKLHFHLFSKDKVKEATLKPNQWAMFLGGDRAGNDNVLEADLQESTELEDLELKTEAFVVVLGEDQFSFRDE